MKKIFLEMALLIPFNTYLHNNNLDIRIKSIPGWMRIINSPVKRNFYNLDLSNYEIKIYTKELENKYIKQKEGGQF